MFLDDSMSSRGIDAVIKSRPPPALDLLVSTAEVKPAMFSGSVNPEDGKVGKTRSSTSHYDTKDRNICII